MNEIIDFISTIISWTIIILIIKFFPDKILDKIIDNFVSLSVLNQNIVLLCCTIFSWGALIMFKLHDIKYYGTLHLLIHRLTSNDSLLNNNAYNRQYKIKKW